MYSQSRQILQKSIFLQRKEVSQNNFLYPCDLVEGVYDNQCRQSGSRFCTAEEKNSRTVQNQLKSYNEKLDGAKSGLRGPVAFRFHLYQHHCHRFSTFFWFIVDFYIHRFHTLNQAVTTEIRSPQAHSSTLSVLGRFQLSSSSGCNQAVPLMFHRLRSLPCFLIIQTD